VSRAIPNIAAQPFPETDGGAQFDGPDAGAVRGPAVVRLSLSDFRCYGRLRLDCDARPVILAGPNGAGKTNLLEAISFLAPGRGLRRARLREVDRRVAGEAAGGRPWAVAVTLDSAVGPVRLGTGRDAAADATAERRLARADGQALRSHSALANYLVVMWLTPQMDRLFVEGAAARRRFLDRLVYGFDPAHAGRLGAYEHAMRERARLLREGRADRAWLGALEETMAAHGVAASAARRAVSARLDAAAREAMGAFPRAGLAVDGTVEDWLAEAPALAVEDRLRAALEAGRARDAESGGAAVGPHRSDLAVYDLATGRAAAECSTGEQKALLLSLVLAHARLVTAERGQPPVLLLDEVAAHLDAGRRAALFEEVCALGAQAWLTGTEAELFDPLRERAQYFRVADATVTPGGPAGRPAPGSDR
jgi:DNA replication and repair protein RecF